jgi:hypothetical protein
MLREVRERKEVREVRERKELREVRDKRGVYIREVRKK